MARYNKTTFSNSHTAASYQFNADASEAGATILLNVLYQNPAGAKIYSIGATLTPMTLVGTISVPSDLLTQAVIGATYYSDLGAAISVTSGYQIAYNMKPISAEIDGLAAGRLLNDSFLYAIQLGNGTVSWNAVQVAIVGLAADLAIHQQVGFVTEAFNWKSPPANPGDVATDGGAITAYAASGNLTTIAVSPTVGNHGGLSVDPTATFDGDIGVKAYHFMYSVSEQAIYDTGRGFGEKAFTDTWSVTTANGTTMALFEDVYGNIHAPVLNASASASAIAQGASVGLVIAATDHDDNASIGYTISGVSTGATLSDGAGSLIANLDGSYSLTGAQLVGLRLAPGASFLGSIDLTVVATNVEGTASASSSAHVSVTVLGGGGRNHAPTIVDCLQNVTAITLSTTPGHIMVGDYFGGPNIAEGFAYDGSHFLTVAVPGAVDTRINGVNSSGVMVGGSTPTEGVGPYSGFVYNNGVITLLVDPLGTNTEAHGINDAGQIVGEYQDATGWHGFLYSGGIYQTLDFPSPTVINTAAEGINDKGQISGTYRDVIGSHGFVATPHGSGYTWVSFDAPTYNPGQTLVVGINNESEVAGGAWFPGPPAFTSQNGNYSFFSPPFGYYDTWAYGVDDLGEVVGTYYTNAYHGYIYDGTNYVTIDVPPQLNAGGTVLNSIHGGTTGAGVFAFSDGDLADTHTVSSSLISASLSSGTVSDSLTSALRFAFSAEVAQDSTNNGIGEINWNFDIPSALASALPDAGKLIVSYDVTVADNHGGYATQNVDLTIIGASDWFHISSTS